MTRTRSTGTAVVIGIGNPWRRDDGIGRHVAGALRRLNLPDRVRIVEVENVVAGIVDELAGAETAVIVDAARSGRHPPGTIHRVDAHQRELPLAFAGSTHAFGLADAVEMARALGQLPPRLLVIGVEVGDLDHGRELTPAVAAAVPDVVRAIADVLGLDVAAVAHGTAPVGVNDHRQDSTTPPSRTRIPTMHEMSLLAGIMKQIERIAAENDAKKVLTVRVTLGALAHISPDHFREHFEEAAVGTVAEGAELEVRQDTDESDPDAQEIILNSVDVDD